MSDTAIAADCEDHGTQVDLLGHLYKEKVCYLIKRYQLLHRMTDDKLTCSVHNVETVRYL